MRTCCNTFRFDSTTFRRACEVTQWIARSPDDGMSMRKSVTSWVYKEYCCMPRDFIAPSQFYFPTAAWICQVTCFIGFIYCPILYSSLHETMDRHHLGRCIALSSRIECERYWEARTKMMENWLFPFYSCDYSLLLEALCLFWMFLSFFFSCWV